MPWVRAMLRGQKVFARADERGELVREGGRVEIRYNAREGRRYAARADNLEIVPGPLLPDDTCGPAEAPPKADAKPAKPAARAKGARAKKVVHTPSDPPEGAIVVYADGACSGNPGPAGLGIVILNADKRVEISEYLGEGTNNIAELTAVLRALEEIGDPTCPVLIHTDSQYTIGVVQKGWKAKANVELVAELREAFADHGQTRLVYVPGHAGVPLNERADELAREAVRSRSSKREELVSAPRPAPGAG